MQIYILTEKALKNFIFFQDSIKREGHFSFFLVFMVGFSLVGDFFAFKCGHTKVFDCANEV